MCRAITASAFFLANAFLCFVFYYDTKLSQSRICKNLSTARYFESLMQTANIFDIISFNTPLFQIGFTTRKADVRVKGRELQSCLCASYCAIPDCIDQYFELMTYTVYIVSILKRNRKHKRCPVFSVCYSLIRFPAYSLPCFDFLQ